MAGNFASERTEKETYWGETEEEGIFKDKRGYVGERYELKLRLLYVVEAAREKKVVNKGF